MPEANGAAMGCPWSGRGASKDITGCRFSLSPMCDDFASHILDAIARVDTGKVWGGTDHLSTVYRGKRVHVVDTVRACFTHAYRPGLHMSLEATFSKGCPGDTDADAYLSEDDAPANAAALEGIHFPVDAKIAFYPLGRTDYMEHITRVVNLAIARGLYLRSAHYATLLFGDVQALFGYFDEVLAEAGSSLSHYVLEATLSVCSPSKKEGAGA